MTFLEKNCLLFNILVTLNWLKMQLTKVDDSTNNNPQDRVAYLGVLIGWVIETMRVLTYLLTYTTMDA